MRRFATYFLILIAILALFPLYSRYKLTAGPIPPGVLLGGLDLSNLKDPTEIREHLERIYMDPIAVDFAGEQLVLRPSTLDFTLDVEQMMSEASQYLDGPPFIDIAIREALGFTQQRRDVPVRFTLNADKLGAWLVGVAAEQNHGPVRPRAMPPLERSATTDAPVEGLPSGYVGLYTLPWRWVPGIPGYTLDAENSIQPLIAALTSDQNRVAKLALIETPPPPPVMTDLAVVLDSYLADFPGFAAVYVRDLQSGAEANVDADIAFSGMSTLKLALAVPSMQQLNYERRTNPGTTASEQLIDLALGESDNQAANQLLRQLGNGDTGAGARRFTDYMRTLGLVNTYMQSGFDEPQLPLLPTPGNQNTEWNTNPDANLQTTPADMGRMLAAIYECSQGRGALITIAPDPITPDECLHILFYMSHNQFQDLVWGGLPRPQERWIVHKHGFTNEAHGDVALVWGPTGPYVIAIFLYQSGWLPWETSNGAMSAVSRITWDFFALQSAQGVQSVGAPPQLQPPPSYVAIGKYTPTLANPAGQ